MEVFSINNKILNVEFLKPGTGYTRPRFDWAGIIKQVSIGETSYLGNCSNGDDPCFDGIGLTNEFGMRTPLSYWKTLPGKEFMKIGVGALTKSSILPYSFLKDYKFRPFETEVKTYEDRVEFIQNCCEVVPYRYDYTKTVSIEDNNLSIHYQFKNTGHATIKTEEYNHNFLRLNNKDVTPESIVTCNNPLKPEKIVGPLKLEERQRVLITKDNNLFYTASNLKTKPENFRWEVVDGEGYHVECTENFPASRFALWGMKHVISPEVFHSFSVEPGEDISWNRTYSFNLKNL